MAFGAFKGSLVVGKTSATNPTAATGSVAVVIGDLIVCLVSEYAAVTNTGVTDSLGNGAYTAQNAGNVSNNASPRVYWKISTVAGTLTSVSAAMTASGSD